jgi:adenosylcobyric acid synthase
MGESASGGAAPFARLRTDAGEKDDGAVSEKILGSYVHGLFDSGDIADRLAAKLLADKGLDPAAATPALDHAAYKEQQYDQLADVLRGALDMDAVYRILENA